LAAQRHACLPLKFPARLRRCRAPRNDNCSASREPTTTRTQQTVVPAKAGTDFGNHSDVDRWIPAFAGRHLLRRCQFCPVVRPDEVADLGIGLVLPATAVEDAVM